MCLAIPGKITELEDGGLATVNILGVTREISVDLTPKAQVGDYVLVHAGFAIEIVDEQYAQETVDLIMQFPDLAGDNAPYLEDTALASEPKDAVLHTPESTNATYEDKNVTRETFSKLDVSDVSPDSSVSSTSSESISNAKGAN